MATQMDEKMFITYRRELFKDKVSPKKFTQIIEEGLSKARSEVFPGAKIEMAAPRHKSKKKRHHRLKKVKLLRDIDSTKGKERTLSEIDVNPEVGDQG